MYALHYIRVSGFIQVAEYGVCAGRASFLHVLSSAFHARTFIPVDACDGLAITTNAGCCTLRVAAQQQQNPHLANFLHTTSSGLGLWTRLGFLDKPRHAAATFSAPCKRTAAQTIKH